MNGSFHSLSHHLNEPGKREQYEKIINWHVEQVAYFLNKVKSLKEGESSLLDNSMILFGSSLKDGNRHDPENLPLILAGRGKGTLRPGRRLRAPRLPFAICTWPCRTGWGFMRSPLATAQGPSKDSRRRIHLILLNLGTRTPRAARYIVTYLAAVQRQIRAAPSESPGTSGLTAGLKVSLPAQAPKQAHLPACSLYPY